VTLGHHLMAYYEMAARDVSRFADARAHEPVAFGRAGGHRFSHRPFATAKALDFDRPLTTASIGVGPRFRARLPDGGGAMLAAPLASGRGIHHLGFAALLSSACPTVSTGSSIMPQRRTPTPPNWCAVMPGASSVL
jgi:argininosuccinate lyase